MLDSFSDKERTMLKQFFTGGEKGEGLMRLKMRISKNYPLISEEFEMIKQVKMKLCLLYVY